MKVGREYSAEYKCISCDATRTETATASDYMNALTKLPRWIWPNNHRMARVDVPTLKKG